MGVLARLSKSHEVILLTPNPITFYDYNDLRKSDLIWLYKRYVERKKLVEKFSKIVPTRDLKPTDMVDVIDRFLSKRVVRWRRR